MQSNRIQSSPLIPPPSLSNSTADFLFDNSTETQILIDLVKIKEYGCNWGMERFME